MKLKVILCFGILVLFFSSCCNEKDKGLFFVLKERKLQKNEIPMYYCNMNFILYNDTTIYFHNRNIFHGCGTGIDFTKPDFLYLEPDSLKHLSIQQLTIFLDSVSKITYSRKKNIIVISSAQDTIRNRALLDIRSFVKKKGNFKLGIRKCTEEEQFVATAKFTSTPYDLKKCNFKIGLSQEVPGITGTLEFIPPKEAVNSAILPKIIIAKDSDIHPYSSKISTDKKTADLVL